MVILITGGSSGLGAAMCRRLGRAGHVVYGTSRSPGVAEGFTLVTMDLRDEASVNRCVEAIVARHGRIDAVVNNAGVGVQGPVEDITPEVAHHAYDVNVVGALRVCRAALPHMRAQGSGLVLNISSIAGNFGLPYRGFYSATKAALDRMTESLRIETKPFGIRVVTVQPGEFKTPIAASRLRPAVIGQAYNTRYDRAIEVLDGGMGYSRDPDELARVVERIINDPSPRTIYRVAKGVQILSVLLKKLLPGHLFERMVARHYE
jgi:NAD(P)-dependent dehydrogenase (short-subunit alcohol dehydrogenase family)